MGKHNNNKKKSLCLVLGGSPERERKCIHVASAEFKNVPIWLSGPALTESCLEECEQQGCDLDYLLVDYRALDTLSNFTTLVDDMKRHEFTRVHLVTSECHMDRGLAVANVILPFYDIEVGDIVSVPDSPGEVKESSWLVLRDSIRAWLWVLVGLDITYPLILLIHKERIRQRKRRIKNYTHHGNKCFS